MYYIENAQETFFNFIFLIMIRKYVAREKQNAAVILEYFSISSCLQKLESSLNVASTFPEWEMHTTLLHEIQTSNRTLQTSEVTQTPLILEGFLNLSLMHLPLGAC